MALHSPYTVWGLIEWIYSAFEGFKVLVCVVLWSCVVALLLAKLVDSTILPGKTIKLRGLKAAFFIQPTRFYCWWLLIGGHSSSLLAKIVW